MPIVVDDVYVDESQPFAQFTIRLTDPSTVPVSFSYSNSNETAANGSDYVAQSGTLTFAPGQTVLTLNIPLIGNAVLEPTEMFTLNLFNPVNSTIATPFAQAIVYDNDQPSGTPVVRVSDQTVDEASGKVSFVVTLDKPSTGAVSVNYATVNGTALAGSDYTAVAATTLTFAPGEVSKVVTVNLINDSLAEGREYFDLKLSSPVGATLLAQPTGRASIGANDAPAVASPLITVADAVADESSTFLEFVVSLSAPSTQAVSVSYNNSNITAANGSDYGALTSTLTFAPGETTKVVKIPVLDTAGVEPTEVMSLNLFSAVNATIARPFAIGTIYDNDQASGTPVIRVQDQVVDEAAGQVQFVVTLDKPSTGNVSVNYATVNGTALAGSDYTAPATQTLTFTPGEMVKVVTVDLINDSLAEGREYFDLKLSSPVGATLLAQPTGRASIGANDAPAVASPLITVADAVADESSTFLEFVVSLSAPSTQAVSVSYNNSNITAANGSDYGALTSTLTFAPGETTKVVKIPVLDTAGVEPTEVMSLNLFSAVNATIARPFAIGTIYDNDQASGTPKISVSDGIVNESEPRATFTVTLDKPSTSQVTVKYATADGNATAGSDYEAQAAQTLVFAPGEVSKSVYVDLRDDAVSEPAEFFDLTLSAAVNAAIADPRGHMVIAQSDAPTVATPVISASSIAATEGSTSLEFDVVLSAPSTQTVSVSYNNSNATAGNGSDYVALSGSIVFQPGEVIHTVKIPLLDNLTVEPTETFGLNLFSPVNATVGTSSVIGTILDNDGPPASGQLLNTGTGSADVLVGQPGSNAVSGGAGNDVLDGVNGVTMAGGTGNDLYIVESATDVVTEAASAGTDTVVSYVNYTLGANVENLILRGTAALGTGNTLNNTISGNASANTLDGGTGADAMAGGAGNDTYVVDNAGDKVTETANAGTDTVKSSLTYTLGANVENLTLTGAAALNGTGNTLNNVIVGNTAANVLTGGDGADTLTGGGGANTFVFNSSVGGFDTITDWHSATDTFKFSMAGVHVGDGDTTVENAVVRAAPGGFSKAAELVIFTSDIVGAIDATSAAAKIGSATAAYAVGADVLFAVDNGTQTGLFLFHSAGADALVSAAELTQIALVNGDQTTLSDYVFGP